MNGLPLSFTEPWLLAGLIALPALWWLLRVIPPRPMKVNFPPTRLLLDIKPREETPSRTPWWLTLLRLLAAALVIFAAAGPVWNPNQAATASSGPLVILLDDGWSAAASWQERIRSADELISHADATRRAIALVPLSEPARDITLMPAGTARVALRQLAPKPYGIDRSAALPLIKRFLGEIGDATDQLVVGAIVDIARGLETETIAECIEDADTVTVLRRLGVQHGQGFHLGRPEPLATIPALQPAVDGP